MSKVVVGVCRKCGRQLRVVERGVKETMHLTCKCRAQNTLRPPAHLVRRGKSLADELKREQRTRKQEEMERALKDSLAKLEEEEGSRRQAKETELAVWCYRNRLLSLLMGIRDFGTWRIANLRYSVNPNLGGGWHPPVFPKSLAARVAWGGTYSFGVYALVYANAAKGTYKKGARFLIGTDDVRGLRQAIEWSLRVDFHQIVIHCGSTPRRLASKLAPYLAAELWPVGGKREEEKKQERWYQRLAWVAKRLWSTKGTQSDK